MTQPVEFLYVVPVGAVIAWTPPPHVSGAPPGFAFCDGSLVSDTASLFYGWNVPDLRSQFVLGTAPGSLPIGSTQGSAAANVSGPTNLVDYATSPTQAAAQDVRNNVIVQDNSVADQSYRYVLTDTDAKKDGNHHHVIPRGALQVAPPGSVALYYIIRII